MIGEDASDSLADLAVALAALASVLDASMTSDNWASMVSRRGFIRADNGKSPAASGERHAPAICFAIGLQKRQ